LTLDGACMAMCVNETGNVSINVTLTRIRVTILAVEKQYALNTVSVCDLSYPACSEHAQCSVSSVASTSVPYFSILSHKGCGLRKKSFCA
jgi:hypothetical protein